MIAVARSWILLALVVCSARAQTQGAAAITTANQAVPIAHAAAVVADPSTPSTILPSTKPDTTAPPEITASPRPLLLYIPFHVSEPSSHITDMIDCTFRLQPWRDQPTHAFDVLLAISGLASAGNEQQLQRLLEDATAGILPRPRVFVEFVPLKSDRYVQDIDDQHKDADWVGGPNTAFYDAFLDGHIFHKYVQHYSLVQQLETDVCALKAGWLDDLVAPAANKAVLISGSTIKVDCIYVRAHDRCEINDDEHMRRHVNGNALYRVGADLTAVLTNAKAAFSNAEPFDLAIFWAVQAMGIEVRIEGRVCVFHQREVGRWRMDGRRSTTPLVPPHQDKLHSNPASFNLATLVDTSRMLDAAYYGGNATVVHVPRRLRSCIMRSVATRGYVGLPLTVIVVDDTPQPSLARLIKSLTRHQIERYILVATSAATFVELSKTYPLRVLPVFVNGVDHRVPVSTKIDDIGLKKNGDPTLTTTTTTTVLKSLSLAKRTALPSDDKLACEPWMRDGASSPGLLLTIVARLIRMGYAPFVVDQRALVIRDYELALLQTPGDAVYVTGKEAKQLRAASNVSAWRPALAYFPRSEVVASTADALATLVDSDQPLFPHLPFKTFAPHEIADTGPFDDLSFPLVTRRKQLVRSPSADVLAEFDGLVSRATPHTHARCANYSVAVARSIDVQGGDVADGIQQVIATVALARAKAVSCVVLPNLVFKRRSAATLFKIVDTTFFTQLAGDVRLVPSVANIDTKHAPFVDLGAHHQHARTETSVCGTDDAVCFSASVRAVLAAVETGLGRDYTCVRSTGIEHSDNAFVLRRQVDALARAVKARSGKVRRMEESAVVMFLVAGRLLCSTQTLSTHQVFLRGTWRHLPVDTWDTAPAPITTLAHVRATLNGQVSPYTAQPFGEGDSIAFDDAWADALESIVCAGAKTAVTVKMEDSAPPPTESAFLAGTPRAAADMADFRAWLRRPDRPSLRGPVLVVPAAASCDAWARAARLGLMLAYVSKARHVVLPAVDASWHINTTALHAAFPSLLPPTVAHLLHPRLTFDVLFDGGNATVGASSDASLTRTYAPELTFIERTRRAAAPRTVLWAANATDSLHTALKAGLSEWDWMVVRNVATVDVAVEHAVRAAVTLGSSVDGFTHLTRVDAAFGAVCVAARGHA